MNARILARGLTAASLFLAPWLSPVANAQCNQAIPELTASNGMSGDEFGRSVAVSGSWMAVGAPDASGGLGSVYLYKLGVALVETEIPAPYPGNVSFGASVAISGNWMVVGDPLFGGGKGRVHLYQESGGIWSFIGRKRGGDGDLLGYSVTIDGLRMAAGAPGNGAGEVRLYEDDGTGSWPLVDTLTPGDGGAGDLFGFSVSLSADPNQRLAVGAPLHQGEGAVYMYKRSGLPWSLDDKLMAPNGAIGQAFGYSVSTNKIVMIVGEPLYDGAFNDSGAAHIFRRAGGDWSFEQTLLPSNPTAAGDFGYGVSIFKDVAAVGAPYATDVFGDIGDAYHFRDVGTQWVEQARYRGAYSDAASGASVHTDGVHLVYGGPSSSTGFAYLHELRDLDLDVDPDTVSMGDTVELKACGGVPGSLAGLFAVEVNGMPLWQPVLFGLMGAGGTWNLSFPYSDPTLSGLDVDLLGLSINVSGKVVVSNQERLQFN